MLANGATSVEKEEIRMKQRVVGGIGVHILDASGWEKDANTQLPKR